MTARNVIAIDGQSYVGKSTTSYELAKLMGCIYINTGQMYRAVASKAIESGVDPKEADQIISIASKLKIDFTFKERRTLIIVNGRDLTNSLDNPTIVSYSSKIAPIDGLRQILTEIQRSYAKLGTVIFEGRDIGTIVFPNALWKFFITASLDVRARRMKKTLIEKNQSKSINVNDLIPLIASLDERDTNRKTAPLKRAKDAIIYDNSDSPTEHQDAIVLQYYINHHRDIIKNANNIKRFKLGEVQENIHYTNDKSQFEKTKKRSKC